MRDSLSDRLLRRELQDSTGRMRKIRAIYGDRNWIRDLDIVNELDGHSGCVNALSWSKSGRLLASGSDDQHVNIHSYQPHDTTSQFSLVTTVATGHRANIFSVKFMPHSNDRTLVTAAGDSEVRVFDLEYSGAAVEASPASAMASQAPGRRRGRNNALGEVRHLSDGNTDCRVYRSHGDRVKRIVTESSPHLFLTCSEDGEVRQWDLRQPSSAYPPPSWRTGAESSVPPPLISYKRYDLDLNTISCSPSQPHYIALGGAHLHCFLHDRRMLGRDKLHERAASPIYSDIDPDLLGHATQCVRKFAPMGQPLMKRTDSGHITACKISDARPNDLIVSWSGDHIYGFDLVRSPDASEVSNSASTPPTTSAGRRTRESSERKRKRRSGGHISLSPEATARAESRQRTQERAQRNSDMALRVQYQNGQSEDIPIESGRQSASPVSSLRESFMTDKQRIAYRLARTLVNLRKSIFTLDAPASPSISDPTGQGASFVSARNIAASLLPTMTDVHRTWRYPIDPSPDTIYLQRTLRSHRESAWRFVQASGVIARALSGRQHAASSETSASPLFLCVDYAPNETRDVTRREMFAYSFIRAIFLWLDSGVGALIEGFTRSSDLAKYAHRLPVPKDDEGAAAVQDHIVPWLLSLASEETSIYDVDSSRFEVDENRILYGTEVDAVKAFAQAVKIPFADLSSAVSQPSTQIAPAELVQDRNDALLHWGLKVARGVLMNAGENVDFALVDRAFGGLGTRDAPAAREEARLRERQQDIDPNEEEAAVQTMEIVSRVEGSSSPSDEDTEAMEDLMTGAEDATDEELEPMSVDDDTSFDTPLSLAEDEDDEDNEEGGDADSESDEGDAEGGEEDDDDDEEEGEEYGFPRMMYRSAYERRRHREEVEKDVPCSSHTRRYQGHCNVKTVKDVNFFGLDDEYVVSGSDDGNVFIWDRKTAQLVNILEGDGEVVNVLQGHPYEPMMAVSGIDHTVKIFSPDSRAREAARLGRGIEAADTSGFSSISWASRNRGRRPPRHNGVTSEPAMAADDGRAEDGDDYVAPNGLYSRKRMHLEYQITSRNDVERQGGNQEAFLTRSMLASLAQHIRRQRGAGGPGDGEVEGEGEGEEGVGDRIVIGDDCVVM